jgi:DNA-binding transcriptional regulator YhcF (GntR family)
MGKKRTKKPDATGRGGGERFVKLDFGLLRSAAYRGLSPLARALLVEIAMTCNGQNNGQLSMSVRMAQQKLGVASGTASKALKELEAAKFIIATRKFTFDQKSAEARTATEWRATWLPTNTAQATRDFRPLEIPAGKNPRSQNLIRDVPKIDTKKTREKLARIKICDENAHLERKLRIKNRDTYILPPCGGSGTSPPRSPGDRSAPGASASGQPLETWLGDPANDYALN